VIVRIISGIVWPIMACLLIGASLGYFDSGDTGRAIYCLLACFLFIFMDRMEKLTDKMSKR
jgi:hypothetical protein